MRKQKPFDQILGWSTKKLYDYLYSALKKENGPTIFSSARRVERQLHAVRDFVVVDSLADLLESTRDFNQDVHLRLGEGLTGILKNFYPEIPFVEEKEKQKMKTLCGTLSLCGQYDFPGARETIWGLLDSNSYRDRNLSWQNVRGSVMKAAYATTDQRNNPQYWHDFFCSERGELFMATALEFTYRLDYFLGLSTAKKFVDRWQNGDFRDPVGGSLLGVILFDIMEFYPARYAEFATELKEYWEVRLSRTRLEAAWQSLGSAQTTTNLLAEVPFPGGSFTFGSEHSPKNKMDYIMYCYRKREGKQLPLF